MMAFRTVKAAIVQILGDASIDGGYRVIGYHDDAIDAGFLSGANRVVQVYAQGGDFPKSAGAFSGPMSHDVTVNIDLTSSANASVDMSVLDDPYSSASQISAALAASQRACEIADTLWDEFFDYIYQTLMDNRNIDMRIVGGAVANRWISKWSKAKPMTRGEMVIIHGIADLTLRVSEDLLGATPITPTPNEAVLGNIKLAAPSETEILIDGAAVIAGG